MTSLHELADEIRNKCWEIDGFDSLSAEEQDEVVDEMAHQMGSMFDAVRRRIADRDQPRALFQVFAHVVVDDDGGAHLVLDDDLDVDFHVEWDDDVDVPAVKAAATSGFESITVIFAQRGDTALTEFHSDDGRRAVRIEHSGDESDPADRAAVQRR